MRASTRPFPERSARSDESFGLRISLFFHLGIVAMIVVKSLVFPSRPILYIPSLRVDLVGLPDILKKDLNQIGKAKPREEVKEVEPPKPVKNEVEPPAKDEMLLKPKPQSQNLTKKNKSALDRIKALSKIAQFDESDKKAPALIKGNQVSKGTSLSGEARENSESGYFDSLRERFQENWALPIWLERQKFSAQVQVWIDASGRMIKFAFVKTSGNAQFDEAVKRTLTESQPYPTPPADLRGSLSSGGILVGFPL